jgi:hypothetical protein
MENTNNGKWLYNFTHKDNLGVSHNFGFLKPNRRLKEDGEVFFAAEVSRYAKAGILPKAAWGTILSNRGGVISDEERERYGQLLLEFQELSSSIQQLLSIDEKNQTEDNLKELKEKTDRINDIRSDIQSFESSQISIFENTAEAKARNKTILWWVLNLTYKINEDGSYSHVCGGKTFNDKLEQYDLIEDSESKDNYLEIVLKRSAYLITLWFLGRIDSKNDFALYDQDYSKSEEKEEEKQESIKESTVQEPVQASVSVSSDVSTSDSQSSNFPPEEIKS